MDSPYDTTLYASSTEVSNAGIAAFGVFSLFYIAFAVFMIVSLWKLFTKAGKPGWAAIVPFYNLAVLLEVVGRPIWWLLLIVFVPLLNVWLVVVLYLDLAKSFGKPVSFGVLSVFFPYVTIPILAFGKSQYLGPVAEGLSSFVPAPDRTFASVSPVSVAPAAPVVVSTPSPEVSAPETPEQASPSQENSDPQQPTPPQQ